MPRMAFGGLQDPQVVNHFALEVQGIETATFREASGFESTARSSRTARRAATVSSTSASSPET